MHTNVIFLDAPSTIGRANKTKSVTQNVQPWNLDKRISGATNRFPFYDFEIIPKKTCWKKNASWNIPIIYVYDICHIYIYTWYIYIIRKYKEITPTTWNKPSCEDKCFSIHKLGAVFAHESSVKEHVKVGIWLKTTKFTVRLDEVVILLMVQKSQTTNWDI